MPRQRYHSTAGGAAGLGNDIHIATKIGRARNLGKLDLRTAEVAGSVLMGYSEGERTFGTGGSEKRVVVPEAHVQGNVAAKVARSQRIHILNHVDCAAEDGTLVIGNGIVTNKGPGGEDLYEVIKDHRRRDGRSAPLTPARFRQFQDMWAEAIADGTIASPDISKPIHDEGGLAANGQELLPVARASLIDRPHYADTHLIDWGADMIYDRESALQASDFEGDGDVYGAYQTSMGSAGSLHAAVRSVFPVEQEDFLDAMYIRNAATSLYVPRQHGPNMPTQLMAVG